MKPADVYNMTGIITFTEATRYHLMQLIDSEELCDLILKDGKTPEGAVRHVVSKAKEAIDERIRKAKENAKRREEEMKNKPNTKKKSDQIGLEDLVSNEYTADETETDENEEIDEKNTI